MKQGHLLCMKPGSGGPSYMSPPVVGGGWGGGVVLVTHPGLHKDFTGALKNEMESTWIENLIGLNFSLTISNYFGIDSSSYKMNVSLPKVEFFCLGCKCKQLCLKYSIRDEPDMILSVLFILDEFCRLENMKHHIYSMSFVLTPPPPISSIHTQLMLLLFLNS